MRPEAVASLLASLVAFSSCATFGGMLLYRGKSFSASPLALCALSGLLVGIALLVTLPSALETLLEDEDWPAEHVLLLFVTSPLVMFFMEHVIVEHTHGHLGGGQVAHVHMQGGGPASHQVHVIDVSPDSAKGPTAPGAPIRFSGTCRTSDTCQPCATAPGPADERSSLLMKKKEKARKAEPLRQQAARAVGITFRLFAWLLHGSLDGVVLGATTGLAVLIPLTFAVSVCSLQDVAGVYVYFSSRKCSQLFLVCAIVAFCLTFPFGTGVVLLAFKNQGGTGVHSAAIAKLQCLTAGLFIYMGFFELMPPLPHSRLASLKHFIVFILGLATAFLSDVLEETMHEHSSSAQVDLFAARDRALPFATNLTNIQGLS